MYATFRSDGTYAQTYSDGRKGAEKVYGPSPDGEGSWRLVATRVSDTAFTESMQTAAGGGRWRASARLRCVKMR